MLKASWINLVQERLYKEIIPIRIQSIHKVAIGGANER